MGAEVTMGEMVFSKTLLGRNYAERARLRQAPNEKFFGAFAFGTASETLVADWSVYSLALIFLILIDFDHDFRRSSNGDENN